MRKSVEIHDLKPSDVTVERFEYQGRPAVAVAFGDEVRIYGATDELLNAFWKVTEALDPVSPAEGVEPADLPTLPTDFKAHTIFDIRDETELTESEAVAKWNDATPAEVATEPEDGETVMVPNTFELGEVPRYEPYPEPEFTGGVDDDDQPGPNATILSELPGGVEMEMHPVDWDAPTVLERLRPGDRGELHYRGETWPIQVGAALPDDAPEVTRFQFATDRASTPPPPPRDGDPEWMREGNLPPMPGPIPPAPISLDDMAIDRWDPGL
jgi:hypothetical protein